MKQSCFTPLFSILKSVGLALPFQVPWSSLPLGPCYTALSAPALEQRPQGFAWAEGALRLCTDQGGGWSGLRCAAGTAETAWHPQAGVGATAKECGYPRGSDPSPLEHTHRQHPDRLQSVYAPKAWLRQPLPSTAASQMPEVRPVR